MPRLLDARSEIARSKDMHVCIQTTFMSMRSKTNIPHLFWPESARAINGEAEVKKTLRHYHQNVVFSFKIHFFL